MRENRCVPFTASPLLADGIIRKAYGTCRPSVPQFEGTQEIRVFAERHSVDFRYPSFIVKSLAVSRFCLSLMTVGVRSTGLGGFNKTLVPDNFEHPFLFWRLDTYNLPPMI